MVEKANRTTATVRIHGNQEIAGHHAPEEGGIRPCELIVEDPHLRRFVTKKRRQILRKCEVEPKQRHDEQKSRQIVEMDLLQVALEVKNPAQHPRGDFSLQGGYVGEKADDKGGAFHTFSGISVYHPRFFASVSTGNFSVVPLLQTAMRKQQVTGELFKGDWHDIGTLERLDNLRKQLG